MKKLGAVGLATRQLLGGDPWGEVVMGRNSLFVCRRCRCEYHIGDNDPCAFCDGCKDAVLDVLAETVLKLTPRAPRGKRR